MSTTPKEYQLVFEVFRLGLFHHVVSKSEVIFWADAMIISQNEPDYVLIELAMLSDLKDIIAFFYNHNATCESPIPVRVIFGIAYGQYVQGKRSLQELAELTYKVNCDLLSDCEYSSIEAIEYYMSVDDLTMVRADIDFLDDYGKFKLSNWQKWEELNQALEDYFHEIEIRRWRQTGNHNRVIVISPVLIRWVLAIVLVSSFIVTPLVFYRLSQHLVVSKVLKDAYDISKLIVYFTLIFAALSPFYYLLKKIMDKFD